MGGKFQRRAMDQGSTNGSLGFEEKKEGAGAPHLTSFDEERVGPEVGEKTTSILSKEEES